MTLSPSPAALKGAADAALGRGDLVSARQAATMLTDRAPDTPGAFRLLATVARRQGDVAAALAAYARATAAAHPDVGALVDHASLLAAIGGAADADTIYRRALAIDPTMVEARRGWALVLKRLGRHDEAAALLEALVVEQPDDPAAWQALGSVRRDLGETAAALAALGRAIDVAPSAPGAAAALARVEAEAGLDALPRARRLAAAEPSNPDRVMAVVTALLADGDNAEAAALLATTTARFPGWVAGHAALARMRWENEGAAGFARGFEQALAARPTDGPLWAAWLRALSRVGDDRAVIDGVARARARLGASATLDLLEARAASRIGEHARADALFDRVAGIGSVEADDQAMVHDLRAGRPDRAAARALAQLDRGEQVSAVAHLDLAWRTMADPRADWLLGDPRLVSTHRLPVDLTALGEVLRSLHRTRFAPLEQSLRGGTQTEGPLLHRLNPVLALLRDALLAAAADHVAAMPPVDPTHPLLRTPRGQGRLRVTGSWSVRLSGAGFHVAHIHSEGWLSSAFYVALPPEIAAGEGDRPGWLELGRAPTDYGIDLPPRHVVRPEPGLLVLFPSAMWHGTRPFAAGERLTAAFDLVPRL